MATIGQTVPEENLVRAMALKAAGIMRTLGSEFHQGQGLTHKKAGYMAASRPNLRYHFKFFLHPQAGSIHGFLSTNSILG